MSDALRQANIENLTNAGLPCECAAAAADLATLEQLREREGARATERETAERVRTIIGKIIRSFSRAP